VKDVFNIWKLLDEVLILLSIIHYEYVYEPKAEQIVWVNHGGLTLTLSCNWCPRSRLADVFHSSAGLQGWPTQITPSCKLLESTARLQPDADPWSWRAHFRHLCSSRIARVLAWHMSPNEHCPVGTSGCVDILIFLNLVSTELGFKWWQQTHRGLRPIFRFCCTTCHKILQQSVSNTVPAQNWSTASSSHSIESS
jgi:hypothetical protein